MVLGTNVMRFRPHSPARFSQRTLGLALGLLLVGGGAGVAVGVAGGDDDMRLVYDSVLGRTVPPAHQQALRDVEPSTLPETRDVAPGSGIDPSQTPEEDARDESNLPVPPEIHVIPADDRSNVPFPSGVIAATTLYTESDGERDRIIWAGGAGCLYVGGDAFLRDGSCDLKPVGMIIDQTIDLDGLDDDLGRPLLLRDTGPITFTSFSDDGISFTTETGRSGVYSLTTQRATLSARR
jgi:hypothetical protein